MTQVTYSETLIATHCWCGIAVGLPFSLHRHMKQSEKNSAYCPIGHSFHFGGSFETQLEQEKEARERAERRAQATRDLLSAEERSHTATRGHLTRHKKRASVGVCPCCNRQFQNVARHMKCKHPDFAGSES